MPCLLYVCITNTCFEGCGYVCHSKCLSHAPQLCFEAGNSSGDLHEDLLSPGEHKVPRSHACLLTKNMMHV